MTPPEILRLYEEKWLSARYTLLTATFSRASISLNERIDNQVINTKPEHYQSNCQNHGSYRVPCEILGNSCEKQDCSQENGVEHIGIALLFGGLSLCEGGSSLSI